LQTLFHTQDSAGGVLRVRIYDQERDILGYPAFPKTTMQFKSRAPWFQITQGNHVRELFPGHIQPLLLIGGMKDLKGTANRFSYHVFKLGATANDKNLFPSLILRHAFPSSGNFFVTHKSDRIIQPFHLDIFDLFILSMRYKISSVCFGTSVVLIEPAFVP
jgi:hypothetical protein